VGRAYWEHEPLNIVEVAPGRKPLRALIQMLGAARKAAGPVTALPEVTYVLPGAILDEANLARYRTVCGFSPAQGVPLIYPQMLTFPLVMQFMASEYCPWPAIGTVHLSNSIEQHEALAAGDILRVELQSGELLAHDKGQVYTLQLRIYRDERLVWQASQSLLRVGVKAPCGRPYEGALAAAPDLARQADFAVPAGIGRRYGRVSGDLNPIHLSALSARLLGFPRAIAHGMWTKARALAALLPQHPVARAGAAVDFKTPLLLPATASLWSVRKAGGALFEVRDGRGEKPHLRGEVHYSADPS